MTYPAFVGAACAGADSESRFPQEGQVSKDTQQAVRICLGCPVRSECLAWAMKNDERFGIWGGLNVHQRDDLRYGRPVRRNGRQTS